MVNATALGNGSLRRAPPPSGSLGLLAPDVGCGRHVSRQHRAGPVHVAGAHGVDDRLVMALGHAGARRLVGRTEIRMKSLMLVHIRRSVSLPESRHSASWNPRSSSKHSAYVMSGVALGKPASSSSTALAALSEVRIDGTAWLSSAARTSDPQLGGQVSD